MPFPDLRKALKLKADAIKLKDEAFETRRAYLEGKQQIFETGVSTIEGKTSSWLFALLFLGALGVIWLVVLFRPVEIDDLNNAFGIVAPGAVVFFASYFPVLSSLKC